MARVSVGRTSEHTGKAAGLCGFDRACAVRASVERAWAPDNCELKVNEDQLLDIEITLQKLAFFRCVHENFMEGCGNFILGRVGAMVQEMKESNGAPAFVPLQA